LTKDKAVRVSVSENAKKHLARNIPTDWAGYCKQIKARHFPDGFPPRGVNRRVFERMHRNLIAICFPEEEEFGQEVPVFASKLFDISVRYQALLVSVDQTVSPSPVHKELRRLEKSMERALRALDDKARDDVVVEMGGYDSVEEIPVTKDAFDGASSLAEKVSIARNVLAVSRSQVEHMADHFDYKRRLLGRGKPSIYAFAYAVFALAELFEEHDQHGRKAAVNEKVNTQDAHWTENYRYSGPFLDFVTAFFRTHNPLQIEGHVGTGFASAVRKTAQRRKKAPELHRLLDNGAGAQEVVNFMVGIDKIR